MLDKRKGNGFEGLVMDEMEPDINKYWFDFKKNKFLHNIDTFYYSVKLCNDFTADSMDKAVLDFRKHFDKFYRNMGYGELIPFYLEPIGQNMNLLNYSYGKYYRICLECPEYFHIFMADKVPRGAGTLDSVTCEIIVQIRSYMLWMYGIHEAFERSLEYVQALLNMFGLEIAYVQENRIDYCWHSNYLTNPEKFFSIDNFYKMRVDRFRGANYHTAKVGGEDYEIDYLSLGNRGGKCFIRIYLKSKEVVEQGYKAFFFKLWLFNGLINRYDLYCYEKAYIERSWQYMTIARMEFYIEFGINVHAKEECKRLIAQYHESRKVTDSMIVMADRLTPKIHLVMNVEYQTMRKGTKSYVLLPVKNNDIHGAAKRVYDYLDNRPLIVDYLTRETFRLVELSGDSNKSRRDYCGFWKALRSTKMVDAKQLPSDIRLIREYSRKLSKDIMKKSLINKAVIYGIYTKGINEDSVLRDCFDALLKMNDNDLVSALRYKNKKSRQFNSDELAGMVEDNASHSFVLLDTSSGEIYDNDNIDSLNTQDGGKNYE